MTKRIAERVLYCRECNDMIRPKENYFDAGHLGVICRVCWGDIGDAEETGSETSERG